jgi:hypothetical protein
MKATVKILGMFVLVATMSLSSIKAQGIELTAGLDVYSKYFWRGLSFGNGPQFQPSVSLKKGGFTLGYWGSYDMNGMGYTESDLYASYATSFGLTATVTDYSTGTNYFNTSPDSLGKDHAFELTAAYTIKSLTITGAYVFNEASLPGTVGEDTYIELAYAFLGTSSIAVGAGNGWYTKDTEFDVCNIMVKTVKSLKFSETYSLPVTGIIMLNPNTETLSVGAGLTF